MAKLSLPVRALISALAASAYIALVGGLLSCPLFQGGKGGAECVILPIAGLLLFVFSALVMGTLLVVPSLRLYLDGHKPEGVRLLLFTGLWLGLFTVIAMGISLLQ